MWVEGRSAAYSDASGTSLATPFAGRVRRANYSGTSGNAQAPDDAHRPWRETGALNFQLADEPYLNAPVASNCTQDAITVAIAFTLRDNPGGAAHALFCNGNIVRFWTFSDNIIAINFNGTGSFWLAGPGGGGEPYARCPLGAQIEVVFRMSPTQVRASVVVDGVRTDYSKTITVFNTTLPSSGWKIGDDGVSPGQDRLVHGAYAHIGLIGRTCSDAEVDTLLAFMRAVPAPRFCPPEIPLIAVNGDSIAASSAGIFQVPISVRWSSIAQQILNATQPVNLINAAISGDSIVHQRDVTFPTVLAPFYNAARSKNIHFLAAGTNDIATGGRTGPVVLADQYAAADGSMAAGWLPVVATILPRNPGGGFDVANFNTQAGHYNTHLKAEASGRGYVVCDFASIPQAADPTNTTYYSDGIHPLPPLHVLMGQVAAAAIQARL
jgi:hypothetical protein